MNFNELKLDGRILKAVKAAGYETPSPIQEKAIPPALDGRDVLGCAQTGTGKTAAFALPILNNLNGKPQNRIPRARSHAHARTGIADRGVFSDLRKISAVPLRRGDGRRFPAKTDRTFEKGRRRARRHPRAASGSACAGARRLKRTGIFRARRGGQNAGYGLYSRREKSDRASPAPSSDHVFYRHAAARNRKTCKIVARQSRRCGSHARFFHGGTDGTTGLFYR